MASTSASLSLNLWTGNSNTTTKLRSAEKCPPFPNADFETLGSSVPYIVNVALNVPLAIMTTFANLLVLSAMRHVTSIRLPSKLLLCSLVLTDLGAGVVVQPQFIAALFTKAINRRQYRVQCFLAKSYGFTASFFTCVSLLTMVAISLDRYTALFHYIKYQQIVTARRVSTVLVFTWSCAIFLASTSLLNHVLWEVAMITSIIISLFIISVSYIKIYRRLRGQHGHQVQPVQGHNHAEQQAENTLNMAKYKRTASATMWVCVLYILCYLPFFSVASVVKTRIGHTAFTQCIWEFSYTMVLLNSCLNPFLYCLRLPEIRTEVMKQLRKFCCRSPQQ